MGSTRSSPQLSPAQGPWHTQTPARHSPLRLQSSSVEHVVGGGGGAADVSRHVAHRPGLPPSTQRQPITPSRAALEFSRAWTTLPACQIPRWGGRSPLTRSVRYGRSLGGKLFASARLQVGSKCFALSHCSGSSMYDGGAQSFVGPSEYLSVLGVRAASASWGPSRSSDGLTATSESAGE